MKRKGSIEFRYSESNQRHEIVVWKRPEAPYCYVAAFFNVTTEGYYIVSVGPRLLEAIDNYKECMAIWRFAQSYLDALFILEHDDA